MLKQDKYWDVLPEQYVRSQNCRVVGIRYQWMKNIHRLGAIVWRKRRCRVHSPDNLDGSLHAHRSLGVRLDENEIGVDVSLMISWSVCNNVPLQMISIGRWRFFSPKFHLHQTVTKGIFSFAEYAIETQLTRRYGIHE